jgi:anti-anti-sigma factor
MSVCEILREGSGARVILEGKLTATEVPELQTRIKAEIAGGATEVVVDLASTTQIDSTGIGLLIAVHNSLGPLRGSVQVINAGPDIFGLLRSMRLVERLRVTAASRENTNG